MKRSKWDGGLGRVDDSTEWLLWGLEGGYGSVHTARHDEEKEEK